MRVFEPSRASAGETLDRFASLINDRTRAISISHITTAAGQVLPMEEIGKLAKEHGLFYFVDGAQSAGHIPLDMKAIGCHAYATSGHKWLLGPKGTGLLYVRRDALDQIEAKWVGAYSGAGEFDMATGVFGFADTAQRYEFGTVPVSLFHGLSEAMGFLLDLGMDRVWARSHYLGQRLITGLRSAGAEVVSPLDSSENSGIIVFRVKGMTRPELQSYLAKNYKIRSRGIYEGGLEAVRVSPHIYSTGADVDRVIEAVAALHL
jgi:selenocysteine lyase/cysteine desulfurase